MPDICHDLATHEHALPKTAQSLYVNVIELTVYIATVLTDQHRLATTKREHIQETAIQKLSKLLRVGKTR